MTKKKTHKMWGLFLPNGSLYKVAHARFELMNIYPDPKMRKHFGISIKKVTVIEGLIKEKD